MSEESAITGTILEAGDVELYAGGRKPKVVERSIVIQFETRDDLRRFIKESLAVRAVWEWEEAAKGGAR